MRYIIVGLGSFGSSLAVKLIELGNEVIGVDMNMDKVNRMKDKITHAICLNALDVDALTSLPLENTDAVIVCIRDDKGSNIMATATFKNLNVKRLIGRSLNPLHENVLQAIGVKEIMRPEEESAERWAKRLVFKNIVDSYELNNNYSIVEVIVPSKLVGKTILEIGFRNIFNILILTIIKNKEVHSYIGKTRVIPYVQGIPSPETQLEEGDILVVYGANKDINSFVRLK